MGVSVDVDSFWAAALAAASVASVTAAVPPRVVMAAIVAVLVRRKLSVADASEPAG